MSQRITCEFCQGEHDLAASIFGHVVNCANCGQRFIQPPRKEIHDNASVRCLHCGEIVALKTAVVGSVVTCMDCGGQFAGPAALPAAPFVPEKPEPKKKK